MKENSGSTHPSPPLLVLVSSYCCLCTDAHCSSLATPANQPYTSHVLLFYPMRLLSLSHYVFSNLPVWRSIASVLINFTKPLHGCVRVTIDLTGQSWEKDCLQWWSFLAYTLLFSKVTVVTEHYLLCAQAWMLAGYVCLLGESGYWCTVFDHLLGLLCSC